MIRNIVLMSLAQMGNPAVPSAISARHVHLSRADVEKLFGAGYRLRPQKALSQPEQYACEETVTLVGPKGSIEKVRVLGPERKETQVEFSATDSFKLGVKSAVRMSGDLSGTPGIKLIGPAGSVELDHGAIVAARHLHMSAEEAAAYGLKDGDVVRLKKGGARPTVFENVLVRAGKGHSLEVHLDTDEGNAAMIANGDLLEIVSDCAKNDCGTADAVASAWEVTASKEHKTIITVEKGDLIGEEELIRLANQGIKTLRLKKGAHITPLAKDKAWEMGIEIEWAE